MISHPRITLSSGSSDGLAEIIVPNEAGCMYIPPLRLESELIEGVLYPFERSRQPTGTTTMTPPVNTTTMTPPANTTTSVESPGHKPETERFQIHFHGQPDPVPCAFERDVVNNFLVSVGWIFQIMTDDGRSGWVSPEALGFDTTGSTSAVPGGAESSRLVAGSAGMASVAGVSGALFTGSDQGPPEAISDNRPGDPGRCEPPVEREPHPLTLPDDASPGPVDEPPFIIGGKILSRKLSQLHNIHIGDRRAYVVLAAESDAAGRFMSDDVRLCELGITRRQLRGLEKHGLIRLHAADDGEVGYIQGGVSFSKFRYSRIPPLPGEQPPRSRPGPEGLVMHRDHLLLYEELEDLEAVVLHILINRADLHGRGLLSFKSVQDAIGRSKQRNGIWVTLALIKDTVAALEAKGRILTYQVGGKAYYAVEDAKQHCMRFLPGSRIPPPAGQKWSFSLDSPGNLAWIEARAVKKQDATKKRKPFRGKPSPAGGANPIGAGDDGDAVRLRILKRKPVADRTPDESMDLMYAAKPHADYKHNRTNPAVFVRNVVEGRCLDEGSVELALDDLRYHHGAREWLERHLKVPLEEIRKRYKEAGTMAAKSQRQMDGILSTSEKRQAATDEVKVILRALAEAQAAVAEGRMTEADMLAGSVAPCARIRELLPDSNLNAEHRSWVESMVGLS